MYHGGLNSVCVSGVYGQRVNTSIVASTQQTLANGVVFRRKSWTYYCCRADFGKHEPTCANFSKNAVKIIFLDIDGVLITAATCRQGFGIVDKTCVDRLNRLVLETGAAIVLSSTWRIGCKDVGEVKDLLTRWGVKAKILGRTGVAEGTRPCRGIEIGDWLTEYQQRRDVESFVILDDDVDMGPYMRRLVRTDFLNGLQDKHVEEAKRTLEHRFGVVLI